MISGAAPLFDGNFFGEAESQPWPVRSAWETFLASSLGGAVKG